MRYLAMLFALGLLGCNPADNGSSAGAAPAAERDVVAASASQANATNVSSVTSSVNSSTSQSVTSSTGTGSTSSSTNTTATGDGTSSCSVEHNGRRCEVRCRSPQQAHCSKPAEAVEPACICK